MVVPDKILIKFKKIIRTKKDLKKEHQASQKNHLILHNPYNNKNKIIILVIIIKQIIQIVI